MLAEVPLSLVGIKSAGTGLQWKQSYKMAVSFIKLISFVVNSWQSRQRCFAVYRPQMGNTLTFEKSMLESTQILGRFAAICSSRPTHACRNPTVLQ